MDVFISFKIRNVHGFGDEDVYPAWYEGEPVGDGHEARAERVHGRRTCARYAQRDEHCEELAKTAQGGQDAEQQASNGRAILKCSIPYGHIGSCSCKGHSQRMCGYLPNRQVNTGTTSCRRDLHLGSRNRGTCRGKSARCTSSQRCKGNDKMQPTMMRKGCGKHHSRASLNTSW